jgi:PilZ domain-containing protein
MRPESAASRTKLPPSLRDRHRHVRHPITTSLYLTAPDGSPKRGTVLEISEGGFSATVGVDLNVGDRVQLEVFAGRKVWAFVRHKTRTMYGLEFVSSEGLG